ncbi:caspase family protein [Larkinella sp.]|uniref:caspase family protein n=1 Tax=Larkinella sp. TaxID=2034517 RepID=UPI003BACB38F
MKTGGCPTLTVLFCLIFSTFGQAQTFYALVVADTKDPVLIDACKRDMDVMHRQFVQMAAAIQYPLDERIVAQDDFGQKQLRAVLQEINPQPNDILFLYYTGHGYNLKNRTDRFPILMLEKEDALAAQNPSLLSLHTLLKKKGARLCITLGDCCNEVIDATRTAGRKRIPPKPLVLTNDSLNQAYRKLLLDVTGDVLIASSRPPQEACAHPDSGSFYTRAFDEVLEVAARSGADLSWETVLKNTQTQLSRYIATRFKQSMYEANLRETRPSPGRLTVYSSPEQPLLNREGVVEENQLTEQQLLDFRALTEQKVNEFQRYLSVIADPEQQDNIRELAIENALLLFLNDATMQVGSSNPKTAVKTYPLAIYLRRLKNLEKRYFDIDIAFYDLALVADWEKTVSGYETTATYFQHFQAFNPKGQLLYAAKTAKQIAVDLQSRKDPFYEENRWTVLLGDVRLTEKGIGIGNKAVSNEKKDGKTSKRP